MSKPTEILLSPVVLRDGGFAFDMFSAAEGLKSGFAYRRVEQANYDRKVTLQGLDGRRGFVTVACDTSAEFRHRCEALRAGRPSDRWVRRDVAEAGEALAFAI